MEKESIVYFYLNKGQAAKKYFFSRYLPSGKGYIGRYLDVHGVPIPELYYRKRGWNRDLLAGMLEQYMENRPEREFLLDGQLAAMLGAEQGPAPDAVVEAMLKKYSAARTQMILVGEWESTFEWILSQYSKKVNELAVYTHTCEPWEDMMDYLFMEYGIAAAASEDFSKTVFRKEIPALIIDACREEKGFRALLRNFPRGSLYMDLFSEAGKRKCVEAKRKDIRYLSPELFVRGNLDTVR